ncbi:arginine--tRNA ligase [Solibacillus sp. MA9]|uniref:Arginine--tRNA ligase n=1 Tax=Solibacillus palustris TaxID=2908203 RepID=A0ABS9UBI7_9BACL|nr:arginine--tRNA ligase [Solibacillus sp. MA9]MCH7321534.1 arginine--tRNA ligase [Solibacillus sp. MA9]
MIQTVAKILEQTIESELTTVEITALLEKPKHQHLGDLAFPCYTLAKKFKQAPQQIAQAIGEKIKHPFIQDVQIVGGYINFFVNQSAVTQQVLTNIVCSKDNYAQVENNGQRIVIDFSSPNIAKPFSMGHLRSTVIGNALANIAQKNGYEVVRVNHLGDWGTQFGKLIVAYSLWGSKESIEKAPIQELLKLYVKFHDEAEQDEALNVKARAAFKALEDQDAEAITLWEWFKRVSLEEFKGIYDQLGIQFDSLEGEAFYNDKMQGVVEELNAKQLLTVSDGANVVELDDMPPCLITKQDGATLYATRDLAAAFYRQKQYSPEKIFYVVGNEQTLHFNQFIKVIDKMGYTWAKQLQHVPFGMMLKDGKKMSTRKGRVILLKDVLDEAVQTAKQNIQDKNPALQNMEEVAHQVGVGAVIFNDLKNYRLNDIEFSLEQMMNFEGETGPYVQYTYARISSILEKANFTPSNIDLMELEKQAWPAILCLQDYPKAVKEAFEQVDPSIVAKYVLQLARAFNKYYGNTKILVEDSARESRLLFCYCVATILQDGLKLLGLKSPSNM